MKTKTKLTFGGLRLPLRDCVKHSHARTALALLALLILGYSNAFAEPPIKGTVRGPDGKGIEGVSVTLHLRSSERLTLTDSKGMYRFEGIGTGSYEITFERKGFVTVDRDVTLTFDDDTGNVDVTLLPQPAK